MRYPDGSPARGLLLIANLPARAALPRGTRTDSEGRYRFERSHARFPVRDRRQRRKLGVAELYQQVLKEGQVQAGPDFMLSKGTLVRGRVTEDRAARPRPELASYWRGQGALPKELRHRQVSAQLRKPRNHIH